MCGISGVIGEQKVDWVDKMNSRQRHRGPDDQGVYRDMNGALSLAMRRLAIIDNEGGAQPMVSADGRYALVYNGEIYNSNELRKELEGLGDFFCSDHSDTEVLFKLLQRFGVEALQKINGMFSFAFYDKTLSKLLCARDRFGIKPLYYSVTEGRFAFASELKSLLQLPYIDKCIDRQSIFDYLTLLYVPGEKSIIKGVKKILPGNYLEYNISTESLKIKRWWKLDFEPDHSIHLDDWPEIVRMSLEAAVKRWTISDVPIAASLSGGLDSSALVAIASRSGIDIRTFSLGFSGEKETDWNELPLARQVASKYGTNHEEIIMEPLDLLDDLELMVEALDEPYGGGLPSWNIFKFMGSRVKVGLTGTGGDEIFGNYGKWVQLERRLPFLYMSRNSAHVTEEMFEKRFLEPFSYFSDAEKRALLSDGGGECEQTSFLLLDMFREARQLNVRDSVAYLDINTQLPDEFLHMTDRFSMAHSIEARTPFLDSEFVDVVRKIPAEYRTSRHDLKKLLRRAVAPILPKSIINAPKRGFVIPIGFWLRGRLSSLVEQLLNPQILAEGGIFRPDFYNKYVLPHLSGREDHAAKIWAVLMFQLWHEQLRAAE